MVGIAHTLRYVPMREDLRSTLLAGQNAQRRAIEGLQPDEVLVIEARGEPDAGTIGDIFAMRALQLGAAGVITDGALRDTPAIRRLDIPVYHGSSHAATLSRLHMPLDHQIPIACAGVTVMPGDVIVGDEEGAVVIPAALVEEVAADAYQQELEEEWAFEVVAAGDSTIGVFPVSDQAAPRVRGLAGSRSRASSQNARRRDMTRRSINVDSFRHSNPIPAASRIGPLIASSVIVGRDPGEDTIPDDVDAQLANLFHHVGEMLDGGGGRVAPRREDDVLRARPVVPQRDQHAVAAALPRPRLAPGPPHPAGGRDVDRAMRLPGLRRRH